MGFSLGNLISSIAAPVVGGLFGATGQRSANQANIQAAQMTTANNAAEGAKQRIWSSREASTARDFNLREASTARDFSAVQSQLNRDWQEYMSNSAFQRATTDLEKAGLNRILAVGSSASTPGGANASPSHASAPMPSGAAATNNPTPRIDNVFGQALNVANSALDALKLSQETKNLYDTGIGIRQDNITRVFETRIRNLKMLQQDTLNEKTKAELRTIEADLVTKLIEAGMNESEAGRTLMWIKKSTQSVGSIIPQLGVIIGKKGGRK